METPEECMAIVVLEGEIEELMRRLMDIDMNAVLRLEQLVSRVKIKYIVERELH